LSILSTIILGLLLVVVVQSASIQYFRAPALDASKLNPRVTQASSQYPRGEIVAADGTILAQSVPSGDPAFPYRRVYPLGSLTSGVVGFSGPEYGTWALEYEYNAILASHAQPAHSVEQLLAPTSAADSLVLTLEPSLQKVAQRALAGRDGAAVVLDPRTGAVLALYSNPTYDPVPLTSTSLFIAKQAWLRDTHPNAHGFPPLGLVATQQTFPPGSTFKVITTAAAAVRDPALMTFQFHHGAYTTLPDSNKLLYNSGGSSCGGDVAEMLPESCDPGYALMGLKLGASIMSDTANSFGYNSTPPLDLPNVASSYFPSAASFANNLPGLAYSAIGQENVRATALQQALVAAAVADGGSIMTPHLMAKIIGPDGSVTSTFKDSVWEKPMSKSQAAQIVPLMVNVVRYGTAAGIFPANLDVAAKTGTAQTGNSVQNTDDWMIAFAPANHPTVAIAVVVPYQAKNFFGATVAGPIVKCLVEATLAQQHGLPVSGTPSTCPS
jgi:peptidoglycan glycosyltransferase